MDFIASRQDVAKALNFGEYPVVIMDISKPKQGWDEGVYEGSRVKVDLQKNYSDGTPMFTNCRAMIFVDNCHEGIPDTVENRLKSKIWLQSDGAFLSSSFTAWDVIESAEKAQAPVVKAGQKVVVVYKWMEQGNLRAAVSIRKVSKTSPHCSTTAYLEEVY